MRGALWLLVTTAGYPLSAQGQEATPFDCTQSPYSTLAFMPGEWEVVYTGSERIFGLSSIEREPADECAVKEELIPESSRRPVEFISRIDAETGAHRQIIVGIAPTTVEMAQVDAGGTISFEGTAYNMNDPTGHRLLRLTYTALPQGGFRHQGFVSADKGESWRQTIDLTYRSIRDEGS